MRLPRHVVIDKSTTQCFHVISRVVDRRFIFKDREKSVFRSIMRQMESFCGVKILAYCLMSNHFHILLEVPKMPEFIPESELWNRMNTIYDEAKLEEFKDCIDHHLATGNIHAVDAFYARIRQRMCDLSEFTKGIKQRFSMWYNTQNNRKGTLWEERFKSVLIDGDGSALLKVAAYIELNPVRAGICSDPKDYDWCSFAESLTGENLTRSAINQLTNQDAYQGSWPEALRQYRESFGFFGHTKIPNQLKKSPRSDGQEKLVTSDCENQASDCNPLLCRIWNFTCGLVVGSEKFILKFYRDQINHLCRNRKVVCKSIKCFHSNNLFSYRSPNKR